MRIEPRSDPMTTASPAYGRQYPDEGNRETKPPLGSASSVHPTGAAMKEQSDTPRQTPLVELLLAVPEDARLIYEHSPTESQSIPVGPMCRQAAMELATATRERDEARAALRAIKLDAASLADAQVIALEALAATEAKP